MLINAGSVNSLGLGGSLFQNSGTELNTGAIEQGVYTQTAGQTINNGILPASVDVQGGSLRRTGTINGPVTIGEWGGREPWYCDWFLILHHGLGGG